jgi:hypothetical protein
MKTKNSRINEIKFFLEKMNMIDTFIQTNKEKINPVQTNKISDEKDDTTITIASEIHKIITEYFLNLYSNKLEN